MSDYDSGTRSTVAIAQALSVAQLTGVASRVALGCLQAQSPLVTGRRWQRAAGRAVREARRGGRLDDQVRRALGGLNRSAPAAGSAMLAVFVRDRISAADYALLTWAWVLAGLPLPPAHATGRVLGPVHVQGGVW
jgi:hypothetical protein